MPVPFEDVIGWIGALVIPVNSDFRHPTVEEMLEDGGNAGQLGFAVTGGGDVKVPVFAKRC